MLKNKELKKAEELSQWLDHLNDGEHPMIQDEEIKELVEVATLVKKSCQQEELPQRLIDEVVTNLANEFQARKEKRRSQWLYSGLAGAAAAAVLVVFSQFSLPTPIENQVAQQIEHTTEAPKIVAAVEQANHSVHEESPTTEINTTPSLQLESKDDIKAIEAIPVEEKNTPSVAKVLVDLIPAPLLPVEEEKSTHVAILQAEKSGDISMRKSLAMEKVAINSLQVEKSIQPPRKTSNIMVIPNQTAKSTAVDAVSGDIKQVYQLGKDEEIFIIQSILDESTAKKDVQPLLKYTKDTMNSVSLSIGNYRIRIEGQKTEEELKKIGESLIEKELEK